MSLFGTPCILLKPEQRQNGDQMKALEYRFLTHELYAQKHIETRLTAYLYDGLTDIPTGDTIHYFQRPLATGFYCLILPQHPKRGIIAPVFLSNDGLNELELNLKTCGCLNEPTTTSEPLDAEQRRIITEATGGSNILNNIRPFIEQIRPNYKPDEIKALQWPEIFGIIRTHHKAAQIPPAPNSNKIAEYPPDCKSTKERINYLLTTKPYLATKQSDLAKAAGCTPANISKLIRTNKQIRAAVTAAKNVVEYRTANVNRGGFMASDGVTDRAVYDDFDKDN